MDLAAWPRSGPPVGNMLLIYMEAISGDSYYPESLYQGLLPMMVSNSEPLNSQLQSFNLQVNNT